MRQIEGEHQWQVGKDTVTFLSAKEAGEVATFVEPWNEEKNKMAEQDGTYQNKYRIWIYLNDGAVGEAISKSARMNNEKTRLEK